MDEEQEVPRRWPQQVTAGIFYLISSFFLLYPALSTPVVADDFLNPFSQTADGGSSLFEALKYGWRGGTEGASFRPVGNLIGSAFNWLWLTISARLDISMSTLYAGTKLIVLILCAASAARFWYIASREYGRGIRYWDALVLTSLALFGTLQLHTWSSDPVASYPLAGYGSAVLGFAVLSSAVLCNRNRTWRSYLVGAGLAVVSVLYYELNIGAVIGSAFILASGSFLLRRVDRRAALIHLARSLIFVGAPAIAVFYGRTATTSRQGVYAGTVVRLSGAARAVALGVGGIFPGAAWRLSIRFLGGRVLLVFFVIGLVVFLGWVIRWWAQNYRSLEPERHSPCEVAQAVLVAAAVLYVLFTIVLESVTVRVQDSAPELGFVYTFYAVGSSVIALGLAVGFRSIYFRVGRAGSARYLFCAVGLAFIFIQSTLNWNLSRQNNIMFVLNHRLLDAFDADVPEYRRCEAFNEWAQGPWPVYYREGMRNGLQKAYQYYFDEPFCSTLSAPG